MVSIGISAPAGQAYNAKISHQVGSHFLKAGFEMRASYGLVYVNSAPGFNFDTALTANTYINPNTNVFGDAYATYLLGALGGDSTMYGGPAPIRTRSFMACTSRTTGS